jgi:hypothetical protein
MAKGRKSQPRKKPGLQGAALKTFRSNLAKAKKKGVVRASIDARSQKPTQYMQSKLKRLADVIEGRVAAVKVSPKVRAEFKSAGARIENGRVLVEQRPGVVTSVRKGEVTEGVIFQRRPLDRGYFEEEITLPISLHNVGDMLQWLVDNQAALNKKKNSGDQWGFKINGYRSKSSFGGFEELVDYLSYYTHFDEIEEADLSEAPEFLTIWRVKEPEWGMSERGAFREQQKENRKAARRRRTVQDRRDASERPKFYTEKRPTLSQRERNERYRAKHLDDYKAKAKVRAAKSRANKKGK